MKHLLQKTIVATASAVLSVSAIALPLSEYNLILAEDYNHQSAVWGSSFIGGNMTTGGGEFGTRLDRNTDQNSLTVLGDISGSSVNIMAGNLVYGGNLGATVSFNGSGQAVAGDLNALQSQKSQIISELEQASNQYKNTAATGTLERSGNVASFSYSGTGTTAVFDVNAADVFSSNTQLELSSGSAETVVINVSTALADAAGTIAYDFFSPGGINFGSGFNAESNNQNIGASNILWNFFDATNLDLQALGLKGSVLAMGANILSIGTTDGSIAARSLIQDSQIHDYNFIPPSEVPLPASIYFLLMGLLSFFGIRLRKQRAAAK